MPSMNTAVPQLLCARTARSSSALSQYERKDYALGRLRIAA